MYAALKSIASYIPEQKVSNHDFEKKLATSHEWIIERTGIHSRFFAKEDQKTSDLGVRAAELALKRAGITAKDVDMLIAATLSPDYFTMPSTACLIASKLGIKDAPAFDVSAACSGFIYLLSIAKAFIESKNYRNILIVGTEKISQILDFEDRSTCVLFGDGAGAAVIGATEQKSQSILDVHIGADGGYGDLLCTPCASSHTKQFLQMKGNEIFKLAVKTLVSDVEMILQKNAIESSAIDYFIPHQANLRIINAVGSRLNFSEKQIVLTVQKYGNTSAASIPMAMNDIYEEGRLKNGDLMLLDAFGGGLTWGSALVHFDGK
ncbi:beta-ketoacyl-ACP synthase III [Helicobacter mustelae]|uniref:Beta-ketoacyl-[acyl-carrier-protein] synthase III n=1 Tax=Helicobacter mustelae (strain ATCC 43772 / CCUG 25715 / CIP 103759 / LMG 18044 / NCTC 12198 / R85-136P) TaxID=679897 RepID=D3UHM8_HELM1|nr:beta-ketoacyl-ACP synthase III [Helicobacter mustelae]CBG40000.1 3-oxoacyl-[acyl-carrier-protein] synthase [Helicobacter mustelae 12198]SQH71512.1 3-oxoacyl-ACP synthase [Helicobacter mustelae]STP12637.1 3-oxoacyl-ACP synthase [Helicobacter mustelae]